MKGYSHTKIACGPWWAYLGFISVLGFKLLHIKLGYLGLLPDNLATMEKVLPKVPTMKEMKNQTEHLPALAEKVHQRSFFQRLFNGYDVPENKRRHYEIIAISRL